MTTRPIAYGLLTLALLAGCASGAPTGALTAAATSSTSTSGADGSERVRAVTPKLINGPWGDGPRTTSFSRYRFCYTPVSPTTAADDTVAALQITYDGQVTVDFAGQYTPSLHAELTGDELKTLTQISEHVTFVYQYCANVPVDRLPTYTWQVLGTNYDFRTACPDNPSGLTAIVDKTTADGLTAFVQGVAQRLVNRSI